MPFFLPAMVNLGIDPIWFGVLLVINLESAMITPPVGMNLFTIKAITNAKLGPIIRGLAHYVGLMAAVLLVILFVPAIAVWMPHTFMGSYGTSEESRHGKWCCVQMKSRDLGLLQKTIYIFI